MSRESTRAVERPPEMKNVLEIDNKKLEKIMKVEIIKEGKFKGRVGVFSYTSRGNGWGLVQFTDSGNRFPRAVGIHQSDVEPAGRV